MSRVVTAGAPPSGRSRPSAVRFVRPRRAVSFAAALALFAGLLVALGQPTAAQAATPVPGTYVALTPTRLLDTRNAVGAPRAQVAAGGTLTLQVGGRGGVPGTGVSAVVLNVNAVNPTTNGRIIAYATGTTRPVSSSVNFVAGQSGTSLVLSRVDSAGRVSLYNTSTRPVDLVADLSGYFVGGSVTAAGGFVPVTPSRSLDTRDAIGADRDDLFPGGQTFGPVTFDWQVAGRNGIPATGARAVVMAVTVTNAEVGANLSLYPASSSFNPGRWNNDSSIVKFLSGTNFTARTPITNLYVVPIGTGGRVGASTLFNADGSFDVLADVVGYVRGGLAAAPGTYQAVPAMQISNALGFSASIPARSSIDLTVPGDPRATALLTMTARAGNASGALVVHEAGTARPATRNVNFTANQIVSNSVVVRSSAARAVTVYNSSAAPVEVNVDSNGFFRGAAPAGSTLWSKGDNFYGQLAAGWESVGTEIPAPTTFLGASRVYSGGSPSIFAIKPDGSLWAWGSWGERSFQNLIGNPLGLGSTTDTAVPQRVPGVSGVVDVNSFNGGAYFLQANGTVWGTGDGQEGQLSTVSSDGVFTAQQIPGLSGVVAVGERIAVRSDGSVVTWGFDGVQVISDVSDAVDASGAYVLRRNGTVVRIDGAAQGTTPTAVVISGLTGVTAINDRYALSSGGTVWQLPAGTLNLGQVRELTGIVTLGTTGSIGIKADGSLWTWTGEFDPVRVADVPPMKSALGFGDFFLAISR